MQNIFGLSADELAQALMPLSLPSYRCRQIARWIYRRGAVHFGAMSDLPGRLREELSTRYVIERGICQTELHSADGLTTKFLLAFADGEAVETVSMRHDYGHGVCVSSQAGCNMGCAFCASTLHGLRRDLTPGEMLAQAVLLNTNFYGNGKSEERGIDSLVIMGSGEPLLNYDNVLKFIRLLHEPEILNLGYRHITISTSGIVPRIYDLSEENLPLTLSVSLHAPGDELRSRLMPVNRQYPLAELMLAVKHYAERTGRRVTYEYILIDGVNDGREQAEALVQLLRGQMAGVNLIPVNPVPERGFRRPSVGRVNYFAKYLTAHRITATVRKEMGADIAAACGQLRNKFING